jgi:hypothetical protein
MMSRRLFVAALLLAAGCGKPLPPAADAQRARAALETALQAWQKGEPPEALQRADPAIHVNDPAWRSGQRLVKYQIESEQANGLSWRCEVLLTLRKGNGAAREQRALYCIDTDPALVVVSE